ncbi:uncharacterized protein G2W53_038215 [Senna tora]|uniref:Uncharacterized protein n=1 Tax=Senna tora TaxID=362788 RepID=A0A834SYY7_9FABA|nr:uncharacterized protein G2W53_038215 [Senna tora]
MKDALRSTAYLLLESSGRSEWCSGNPEAINSTPPQMANT